MAVSPFDSTLWTGFWGDPEIAPLFSDEAEIAAMLAVEAALARAQAGVGMVPAAAAAAITVAAEAGGIGPEELAAGVAAAGMPVPALVAALRKRLPEEHAGWVHFGATTQDVIDTGLVLRLGRVLALLDARLARMVGILAAQAERHRGTVIAARTRGQIAQPTTLGAKIAVWAMPLVRHRVRLAELQPRVLVVSQAGAAGTNAAMGGHGRAVMAALAAELGLAPAEVPWHAARDGIAEVGGWLALVTGSLGKVGQDLLQLGASEVGEVTAGKGGGSSTMPNKANPIAADALVALARVNAHSVGMLQDAMLTTQERDGAAWGLEWFALPAMAVAAGAATRHALALAGTLAANPERIAATFAADRGMMLAEAAVFALAETMPRPEAQAAVYRAVAAARDKNVTLAEALAAQVPGRAWADILDPSRHTGEAKELVDRLAEAVAGERGNAPAR
ncbi:MAG: lyase family protein [Amaricoccus sp.]